MTVLAGSSAAAGQVASPTMSGSEGTSKAAPHLVGLAPSTDGADEATVDTGSGAYRMLDGKFTDGLGLASTIARMQKQMQMQFSASTANARRVLRVMVLNNNAGKAGDEKWESYFESALNTGIAPGSVLQMAAGWNVPSSQVFQEKVPAAVDWKNYVPNARATASAAESVYWTGGVTTVDNAMYSVEGGWKVELLLFQPNLPSSQNPMLTTPGTSAYPVAVQHYEQNANTQAGAAMPVIKHFFNDHYQQLNGA